MSSSVPPTPPEEGSKKRGCLIAVLVVAVLGIAACGGACFLAQKNMFKLMAWTLEKQKEGFVQQLDSEASPELREAFSSEYDAHVDFLRGLHQRTDIDDDQKAKAIMFQQRLAEASQDDTITAEEMEDFIDASKELRGGSP